MPTNYIPILQAKPGEFGALRDLRFGCRQFITPLIQIFPPKKTNKDYIKQRTAQIKVAWPYDTLPLFVDVERMPDSSSALSEVLMRLPDHAVVPVCGLKAAEILRPALTAYLDDPKRRKCGICYRIPKTFVCSTDLPQRMVNILATHSLTPEDVDLLLDLQTLSHCDEKTQISVETAINGLPHLQRWRSLALAGGSFPKSLGGHGLSVTFKIERLEWKLWTNLKLSKTLRRCPIFSDYGIHSPAPVDGGPHGAANMRYTAADHWVVFRGKMISPKAAEFTIASQMAQLCKIARAYAGFARDLSNGDQHIDDCANGAAAANDHASWKRVAFDHHITFVARQVSNLHAS